MILIRHFREEIPHKIRKKTEAITAAVEILDSRTINIAFSVCDKTDNFNKRKGRTIALGRLTNPRDNTPNVWQVVDLNDLDIVLGSEEFHPSIQSLRAMIADKISSLVTYELSIPRTKKEAS